MSSFILSENSIDGNWKLLRINGSQADFFRTNPDPLLKVLEMTNEESESFNTNFSHHLPTRTVSAQGAKIFLDGFMAGWVGGSAHILKVYEKALTPMP